jgi:hypothetical protein
LLTLFGYLIKLDILKVGKNMELMYPSIYFVRIQGILDASWGYYFGGQIFGTIGETSGNLVTQLQTPLIDQPGMVGLINCLNGLGLCLLSVECVSDEMGQPSRDSDP